MAHRDPRWLDCIFNRFSGPSLQSPFCGGDTNCNILFFFLHCTLRQETFILKFWSEWLREPRKDVISSRVFHTQETPPPKKKKSNLKKFEISICLYKWHRALGPQNSYLVPSSTWDYWGSFYESLMLEASPRLLGIPWTNSSRTCVPW